VLTTLRFQTPKHRVVAGVMLTGFVAGWDASALFFIYPEIRDGLAGGDETSASWVLSITSIVSAALLLQAGRIADRYGHQRTYMVGAMLYTAAAVAAAFAPELWTLVAARATQAAGLAIMGPAAIAIILIAAPPNERAAAVGRWGLTTAVAGVIGPVVVAILIDAVSWRVLFALQIPLGLALVVLGRVDAGIDRPDSSTVIRVSDSVLGIVSLVALVWPIVEGNDWGWASPRTVVSFAIAVGGISILVARSHGSPSPAIPLDLFTKSTFSTALLISVTAGILFFAQWLALLLFLVEAWGYGLVASALLLTLMPGSMMFLSVPLGRVADIYGSRRVMVPGAALYTISSGTFWLTADGDRSLPLLIPVLVTAGIAMAALWPTLTSLGNIGVAQHRLATSSATIQTVQRVGASLGIALVVALVGSAGDGDVVAQHLRAIAVLPIAGLATTVLALLIPAPAKPRR
jgi:MFS family permease